MFLGLQILFLLIAAPFAFWVFIIGLRNKTNSGGKIILGAFTTIGILIISSVTYSILSRKVILEKHDFYGHYVIDRDFFPGKDADWQYNTFRFKITSRNKLEFYICKNGQPVDTAFGLISSPGQFESARLEFHVYDPSHHVLAEEPTIYREAWGFYLVLKSPKFGNMFFRKGKWKPVK